jgi:protein-tyrosine phosphatase
MSTAVITKPGCEAASGGVARPGARRDLAAWYSAGAVVCAMTAIVIGGWGWILAWPAVSLMGVALAYATGSARIFGKRRGIVPVWAYVLFGPYLLGHRISWLLQTPGRTSCSQLLPQLWIGRQPGRRDIEELKKRGVTATLDLTAEFSEPSALRRGADYFNLPTLDLTLPDTDSLRRAVEIINQTSQRGGVIYVHCALGYGRAAVVAAAYLLASGRAADADDAMKQVQSCRPGCVFSPAAVALLHGFSM